jgi:hypothetical protein
MTLPDSKSDLETVLMRLWAMPPHFAEAYRLYALDERKKLASFLNWLSGRANELSPESLENDDMDEENPCVDENGKWIDADFGGVEPYDE